MQLTKHLHETPQNVAGRMNAVAYCGRLVGRLSLTVGEDVTCAKCRAKRPAPSLADDDPNDIDPKNVHPTDAFYARLAAGID